MKPAIHLHFLYKYQRGDNEQEKCENHSKHKNALCDEIAFFKIKVKAGDTYSHRCVLKV